MPDWRNKKERDHGCNINEWKYKISICIRLMSWKSVGVGTWEAPFSIPTHQMVWSCSLLSLLVPPQTYVTSLSHTNTHYFLSLSLSLSLSVLITVNKCTVSVPLTELFPKVSCIGTVCLSWIRRVEWSLHERGNGVEKCDCALRVYIIRYNTKLKISCLRKISACAVPNGWCRCK